MRKDRFQAIVSNALFALGTISVVTGHLVIGLSVIAGVIVICYYMIEED